MILRVQKSSETAVDIVCRSFFVLFPVRQKTLRENRIAAEWQMYSYIFENQINKTQKGITKHIKTMYNDLGTKIKQ